jgi:galactonate dehydratase|nr:galactonate dehydratase [Petroclostridium xylanilyticum]
MGKIKSIQKKNVVDEVYAQMKELIVNGDWEPDSKIPSEHELAKSFNVSRNTVRSAIQKLSAIGVLITRQGQGTFVCKSIINTIKEYVIGRSAGDIEDIWQVLYRGGFYRGGPILTSAISGIEQALWDIKGKALGVPVYELLGGAVRDKIRVYCWIGGDRPQNIAEAAKEKMEQGYTAIKMNATPEIGWIDSFTVVQDVLERVQAIRDVAGYKLDIAVDFHGRVHKGMAKVLMKELEPYKLMFIEEPVLCENEEAFVELKRYTSTPIATGERNYTRWGFKKLLHDGGVDIIQAVLFL